jgi:hypothetical protein
MKREFLQNLKVGEEALPKEVIDAIMQENGRDIQKAKDDAVKPYADYEDLKNENQRLKDQQGDGLVDGKNAKEWKEAHDKLVADHKNELDGIAFQNVLNGAINAAKGKNVKAITALLDVEALRGSEDQQKAVNAALEDLKKDSGYLFEDDKIPPPYARGTGAGNHPPEKAGSLADAIREKFSTK